MSVQDVKALFRKIIGAQQRMERQMEFVGLVDAILGEFKLHGYPLPAKAAGRVAALEREIDERVAALYAVGVPKETEQ